MQAAQFIFACVWKENTFISLQESRLSIPYIGIDTNTKFYVLLKEYIYQRNHLFSRTKSNVYTVIIIHSLTTVNNGNMKMVVKAEGFVR